MGRIVDSGDTTNEVEMKYHYTKYGVKLNIQENFNHVAAIHFIPLQIWQNISFLRRWLSSRRNKMSWLRNTVRPCIVVFFQAHPMQILAPRHTYAIQINQIKVTNLNNSCNFKITNFLSKKNFGDSNFSSER